MPQGSVANRLFLANWLVLEYLIDLLAIVSAGRHPMDALLVASISQANVAHITKSLDLQVAYAEADAPPPNEMRRPISIHAVAQSLQTPFETVRRRVRAMETAGICVSVNGGVIVPTEVVTSPTYLAMAFQAYERVRRLFWELDGHGLLPNLPAGAVEFVPGSIPIRIASRTVTDFNLRFFELMLQAQGDLLDALVLLGMMYANLLHLDPKRAGLDAWIDNDITRDHRRPASASRIATALGMPAETVRRRVHALQQKGLCTVGPRGILLSQQLLRGRRAHRIMSATVANLDRMLNQLAEIGVIGLWRMLGPPSSPAGA